MKSVIYHYDPSKKLIHIPGKIVGPNASRNIRFVFDPGAYRTIISKDLMESIGYNADSKLHKVSTSSVVGKETGYTVLAKQLTILSFTFSEIEVACFGLPDQYEIDGLIGLDILEHFEVTLNHNKREITFQQL